MSPKPMHSLLRRQLRRQNQPEEALSPAWETFLTAVNQAYHDADSDRLMLERSLDLVSQELLQRNHNLSHLLAALPDLCLQINQQGQILNIYGQSGKEQTWAEMTVGSLFVTALPDSQAAELSHILTEVLQTQTRQLKRLKLKQMGLSLAFELRFVPLSDKQCLLIIRNISDLMHAQKQLEKHNRQLLSFHLMSELIMTAPSVQLAQQELVKELQQLTGFNSISIEYYDAERELMVFQASSSAALELPLEVPLEQTLSGLVARSGEPLVEQAAIERPEYAHAALRQLGVQTFVCVPLKIDSQVLGTLSLGSPEAREVSDSFVHWMCSLANYLVILMQRKQAEVELQASKRQAEAANLVKNRFLATMSHELRTPLNSILGFSRILRKKLQNSELNLRDYLERIHNNGMHLLALINDVLDIARIETGHTLLKLEHIALADMVAEILAGFEHSLSSKALQYSCEAPAELLPLQTDAARLQQILSNLIGNAIKFTPAGGEIKVRILAEAGQAQALEVSDTGIGIAPEFKEKIFEAFFQIDSAYNRRYDGTGLGLAICQSLCQALDYELHLSSETGQGTCFQLRFQRSV